MKHYKKLLLTAAFIVLAMAFMATGAGAGIAPFPWVQHDGASLNANGGWQIDDPGYCYESPGFVTRSTCTSNPRPGGLTQAQCQTNVCESGNPAHTTAALCNAAGFAWHARGTWNSTAGECRGAWTNVNFYTWTGTCSEPSITTMTACTANTGPGGNTWNVNNTIYPNGHQSMGSDRQGCLHCHSTGRMEATAAANKQRYLLTGHRNMLRKAPGHPDGPDHIGNVDWTSSNSAASLGFPVVAGATEYASTATTYYVYGGWYRNKKAAQIQRSTPATDNPSKIASGGAYSCSECHTTGWQVTLAPGQINDLSGGAFASFGTAPDGAISSGTCSVSTSPNPATQANCIAAGGVWSPQTWFYEGVQCARCHKGQPEGNYDSAVGGEVAHASAAEFEETNELCFHCHEQTTPEPYQVLVSPSQPLNAYNNSSGFTGHYRSNEFFASPHAMFSGSHTDVTNSAFYASDFRNTTNCSLNQYANITDCTSNGGTWGTTPLPGTHNAGCGQCHDVHVSGVDPDVLNDANPLSNIKTFCQNCHINPASPLSPPQIDIGVINHPIGEGTPVDGDLGTPKGLQIACITCHMTPGTVHLFKINTDAAYSPYVSGSTLAQQFTDNGYPFAVALDVDLACGQCHLGSSAAAVIPNTGAPALTKAQLSSGAVGMHFGIPGDCSLCHTTKSMEVLKHPTPSSLIPGVPQTCVGCHDTADQRHQGALTPDGTCGQCHGGGTDPATNPPANGIMWFGTAELTNYAAGMHNPAGSNTAPVASNDTFAADSFTQVPGVVVSFTDTSTDDKPFPANAVQVIWGDGQITSHNAGDVIAHTYPSAGNFTIRHTVRDAGNLYNTEVFQVKMAGAGVTARWSISVNVTDNGAAPVQGASVYLKKQTASGWIQIKSGYTDGTGNKTFTNLADGKNYKVVVYKSSIDFDGSQLGKQPKAKSGVITLGADTTVDIQQGTSATNGPAGKEWRGDDGSVPTITVTP